MALTMTLGTTTAISQVLNFSGYAGGSVIQVQYASRPDFRWCVAPTYSFVATASHLMQWLNHNATYYIRAREVLSGGAVQAWVSTQAIRTLQTAARDLTVPSVMIQPAMVVVPSPVLEWIGYDPVAGFPVENLAIDAPIAFRASHASTLAIYARIAPEPVDTFALLVTNVPELATIRIAGGNTLATAQTGVEFLTAPAPFRASPNLPGRPGYHGLVRLPSPQTFPWWQFLIQNAAVPGSMFHAEHAIIGLNRATKNHSVDKAETPVDYGSLNRNRAGIPDRIQGYRGRRVDFDISMLSELDYENTYADLGTRVGLTDPVLVVPNSKSGPYLHDRILYGPLVGQKAINPASPRYTRSFTVDSLI